MTNVISDESDIGFYKWKLHIQAIQEALPQLRSFPTYVYHFSTIPTQTKSRRRCAQLSVPKEKRAVFSCEGSPCFLASRLLSSFPLFYLSSPFALGPPPLAWCILCVDSARCSCDKYSKRCTTHRQIHSPSAVTSLQLTDQFPPLFYVQTLSWSSFYPRYVLFFLSLETVRAHQHVSRLWYRQV